MFFVGYFGAPIVALFGIGREHLPSFLSWFDTPDNPLDGDVGFIAEHAPFKGAGQTGFKQYLNRVVWLQRNPSYGFDINVLGTKIDTMPIVVSGDPLVSNDPNVTTGRTTGLSGHVLIRSGNYFEYYYVKQHGTSSTCFRMRLGWKLSGYVNAPAQNPLGTNTQFVFSIKPYNQFTV